MDSDGFRRRIGRVLSFRTRSGWLLALTAVLAVVVAAVLLSSALPHPAPEPKPEPAPAATGLTADETALEALRLKDDVFGGSVSASGAGRIPTADGYVRDPNVATICGMLSNGKTVSSSPSGESWRLDAPAATVGGRWVTIAARDDAQQDLYYLPLLTNPTTIDPKTLPEYVVRAARGYIFDQRRASNIVWRAVWPDGGDRLVAACTATVGDGPTCLFVDQSVASFALQCPVGLFTGGQYGCTLDPAVVSVRGTTNEGRTVTVKPVGGLWFLPLRLSEGEWWREVTGLAADGSTLYSQKWKGYWPVVR